MGEASAAMIPIKILIDVAKPRASDCTTPRVHRLGAAALITVRMHPPNKENSRSVFRPRRSAKAVITIVNNVPILIVARSTP